MRVKSQTFKIRVRRQRGVSSSQPNRRARYGGVILGIAAAGQVAKDAAASLRAQAGVGPVQTEVRLADPGRPGHHGQRAGNQASPKVAVERLDPKNLPVTGHSRLMPGRSKTAIIDTLKPLNCGSAARFATRPNQATFKAQP